MNDEKRRVSPFQGRDRYPCKDCPERALGCHDHCKRYQEARNDSINRQKVEGEKRKAAAVAAEIQYESMLKRKRKKLPQR